MRSYIRFGSGEGAAHEFSGTSATFIQRPLWEGKKATTIASFCEIMAALVRQVNHCPSGGSTAVCSAAGILMAEAHVSSLLKQVQCNAWVVHNVVNGKIKKVACTQIFVLRDHGCLIVRKDFERAQKRWRKCSIGLSHQEAV